MEYDRHVAILQGSILGFEKIPLNENDKCERLSNVLKSMQIKNKVISRKLFMCLLLNTNIKELEKLREIPDYAPLSDLFRISGESFIKLIDEDFWICFLEAIPSTIPIDILDTVIELLVNPGSNVRIAPEGSNFMKIFMLIVAILQKIRLEEEHISKKTSLIKSVLTLLETYVKIAKTEKVKIEEIFFGTLFLLRIACSNDEGLINEILPSSALFHRDLSIPSTQQHITECPQEVLKSVLSIFVMIAKEVTLDTWIDFAEIQTETIMSRFTDISIWESNDHIPSNLQMILAHYTFMIKEYLSEGNLIQAQSLQILDSFSKKYNRIAELQLETMTADDIFARLKEHENVENKTSRGSENHWKITAYSEFLLTEMWEDVMGRTKSISDEKAIDFLQVLIKNAAFIINFCDQLYSELVLNNAKSLLWETKLKLFLAISKHLSLENSKKILDLRLKDHGVNSPIFLNTYSFYNDMRLFLNKIVIKDNNYISDALIVEMNQLILQSPKEVVFYLIQEGLENKGKVDVVSKVLCFLPKSIMQYSVDTSNGQATLLTSALLLKLIVVWQNKSDGEITNFYQIVQTLFQSENKVAKNFGLHMIKSNKIMFLAQTFNVLRLAFDAIDIDSLDDLEKSVFMIGFSQIASYLYTTETLDHVDKDIASILTILYKFKKNPESGENLGVIIHDFLHQDLHGYIITNNSGNMDLRNILKSIYFDPKKVQYSSNESMVLEIATCLPQLLPNEWDAIGNSIYINEEKLPLLDLLESVQILISSRVLENKLLEHVLKSVGKLLSSRIQETVLEIGSIEKNIKWVKQLQSKLCQIIGL